jgi:hypothetical protein
MTKEEIAKAARIFKDEHGDAPSAFAFIRGAEWALSQPEVVEALDLLDKVNKKGWHVAPRKL